MMASFLRPGARESAETPSGYTRVLARVGVVIACLAGSAAAPLSAQGERHVLTPDHLGCLVDDATLAAVAESDFLRDEFAHSRSGRAGPAGSNHFLYGELTFVEFIHPRLADVLGVQVGDCMIALNSGRVGWLSRLNGEMRKHHPDSRPDFRLRDLVRGSDSVPWSYVLDFDYESGIGGLGLWFKEYHPEFKHRMAPDFSEPGDISRDRDGAPAVAFHADKYFRDVTGVTVAVPPERRAQLEILLNEAGFTARSDVDVQRWSTDELEIEMVPVAESGDYAIREIRLALTRPYSGATRSFDLGSVALEFPTDTSAVLRFGRPND